MEIIEVRDPQLLDEFYEEWSFTLVGITPDDESLKFLVKWCAEHNSPLKKERIYLVKGKLMNEKYHLTVRNQYQDDLSFLIFRDEDLTNKNALAIPRFELGGCARWFYDIVENNKSREE